MQCLIWLFSVVPRTSWLPGMLPTYFLNHFEMMPVAPIVTGITAVFIFHIRWISTVRSLYFKICSASFLITLLSAEMATSISMHVIFSLSRIIIFGLLLGTVLSVRTGWFHNMVTFHPWVVSSDFWPCSYQRFILLLLLFITYGGRTKSVATKFVSNDRRSTISGTG